MTDIFAQLKNCTPTANPSDDCITLLPEVDASPESLQVILQLVFGVLAVVALLFVMYSGFQFITAQGEPQKVAKARQSVIYGIIGLAIAISAELIVTFVLFSL